MDKVVVLTTEQIGFLKDMLNTEGQRVHGRPGAPDEKKLDVLRGILTSLEQARSTD